MTAWMWLIKYLASNLTTIWLWVAIIGLCHAAATRWWNHEVRITKLEHQQAEIRADE